MEIQRIGTYKEYPRKSSYSFRPADEGAINNKKREDSGQRSELVRSTTDGDIIALSFKETVGPGERKAIRPAQSALVKEGYNGSSISRRVRPEGISDIEKTILFPLNIDTQSVADRNMIGKVTTDMTGYAINKYREAWAYRFWAVNTLEVYA